MSKTTADEEMAPMERVARAEGLLEDCVGHEVPVEVDHLLSAARKQLKIAQKEDDA